MEPSALEIALFSGILGAGATLLGIIISYPFYLRLIRKQAQMITGAKLRASFAPIIVEFNLHRQKPNTLVQLAKAI